MYNSEVIIAVSVIGGIVAIIICAAFASAFKKIAEEKGHDGSKYFWLCFLFGVIGMIMVAALPDRKLMEALPDKQTIKALSDLSKNNKEVTEQKTTRFDDLPEL